MPTSKTEKPRAVKKTGARNQPLPPGDDVGAAVLGRRIAETVRELRRGRGMSLDDLARASGVSRAALWQIESSKTNPSVGVLWKIAVGFGVPFSELLGGSSDVALLRREDMQVLRSGDGRFESRLISPAATSTWIEVFELRLSARSSHASEAHASGTRELVNVLSGALRVKVGRETFDLAAGDSLFFLADREHVYENPGTSEGRYHNTVIYRR